MKFLSRCTAFTRQRDNNPFWLKLPGFYWQSFDYLSVCCFVICDLY